MAENFVKTLKRDYLPFIDLSRAETALACLPEVVERYNNEHPHSAWVTYPLRSFVLKMGKLRLSQIRSKLLFV